MRVCLTILALTAAVCGTPTVNSSRPVATGAAPMETRPVAVIGQGLALGAETLAALTVSDFGSFVLDLTTDPRPRVASARISLELSTGHQKGVTLWEFG